MHRLNKFCLIAGLVSLFAAGCAKTPVSTTSGAAKPVQKNVCDLLDADTASNYLGGKVTVEPGLALASGNGYISNCAYTSDDARGMNVLLRQNTSEAEAKKMFEDSRSAARSASPAAVDVSGLGGGAFWVGAPQYQLNLVYKNNWLIISVFGLTGDDRLGVGRKVAAALIRNL